MRKRLLVTALSTGALVLGGVANGALGATAAPGDSQAPAAGLSSTALLVENVGQFVDGARFQVHGAGSISWLADSISADSRCAIPTSFADDAPAWIL